MKPTKEEITGRCKNCKYAEMRESTGANRWWFAACNHKPYQGKWAKEIEECPKKKEKRNE